MKTLINYSDSPSCNDGSGFFAFSDIADAFAAVLAQDIKEINVTEEELKCLIKIYDQLLPHNWDRKSFRGVKLNRVKVVKLKVKSA